MYFACTTPISPGHGTCRVYTSYNPHDDESTGRFCVLDADFFCIGLPYTIPISYTVSENP